MNTGTHTHADARSVRIPQFWVPTPTGHRRARHTAAAFERELKAQLEAQRLTAPPRQTAASLTQTFFFLLKKSRSDRCENHTGVCVPTSLRTWVNTECVCMTETTEMFIPYSLTHTECACLTKVGLDKSPVSLGADFWGTWSAEQTLRAASRH